MNIKEYKRLHLELLKELSPKGKERLKRLLDDLHNDVKNIEKLMQETLQIK